MNRAMIPTDATLYSLYSPVCFDSATVVNEVSTTVQTARRVSSQSPRTAPLRSRHFLMGMDWYDFGVAGLVLATCLGGIVKLLGF